MFDSSKVNLNEQPLFFIEIKEQVFNVCQEWGKVDKVYID
jgi:hypothetical protein